MSAETARFGRYEIVATLTQGGMAEIFLAEHRGPGGYRKRLVLKRMLASRLGDPAAIERFVEEARLHASLTHGNLVSILDFGRVENDYFLALDYVAGADLARLVTEARTRCERFDDALVAYVGAEVCRGLHHVHRAGLVHRDVSPRNVLVSFDGEVRLVDFGIAGAATAQAVAIAGTPLYMAPEQARAEAHDGRADLFALALVLAELRTLRRCRAYSDDPALGLARARGPVEIQVDGPLGPVLARAAATNPAERFESAAAMADALDLVLASAQASRAGCAELLAARVRAWIPRDPERADPPPAAPRLLVTQSFLTQGETQHEAAEPPRRPGRALAAGLAAALLIGLGIAALGRAARHRRTVATPEVIAHAPTRPPGVPAPPAAPPPAAPSPGVPSAPPVVSTPARARVARAVVTQSLVVHCAPWCTVALDGGAPSEGARSHQLPVTSGRHVLELRRLEDRRELRLDVGTAPPAPIEARFD